MPWRAGIEGVSGLAALALEMAQNPIHHPWLSNKSKSQTADKIQCARGALAGMQAVDEKGSLYLVLKGYRTMELPDPIDETLLKPLKSIIA
jgi:hypothetical protein